MPQPWKTQVNPGLYLLELSQMIGVLVLDYLMRQSLTSFATRDSNFAEGITYGRCTPEVARW
jgi:hypothetical protein